LVDTVETRIDAWLKAFEEEGIPADREHVASLIGADGKKLAREVAQRAGRTLSDKEQEHLDKLHGQIYDRINTDPLSTAGARPLLVALEQSSLKWAIATSSMADQTKLSIASLELPQEPLVVDGSHVQHAKPAPDLLLQAAERVGVDPTTCWYVGDSVWDMQAAVAANMVAVGVPYGAATEDDLRKAGAAEVTVLGDLQSDLEQRGLI
jgi:HAD superfamily hydrolase (TIGR01509 family)